jgi:hypothetical protein
MNGKAIFGLQVASLALIWILVILISIWVANLLRLSYELHDVPSATFAISIIAVSVFVTLASVLTYVFVGLQKGKGKE